MGKFFDSINKYPFSFCQLRNKAYCQISSWEITKSSTEHSTSSHFCDLGSWSRLRNSQWQPRPVKAATLKIVGLGLLGLTCPRPTGPTGPRPTMTGSFLAFPLFVSVAGISHVAGIASVGGAWLAQPELAWACQLGLPQPGWRDASWQAESLAVLAVCGWLVKAGWLAAVEGGNCFPLTTFP